jgi:preprotein translocase subunit SecA
MTDAIKEESVGYVFNLDTAAPAPRALEPRDRADGLLFTAPTLDTADGVVEGAFAPAQPLRTVPGVPGPTDKPADARSARGGPRPPGPASRRRRKR